MIPYGRQDINQADIDSVLEVLKSDFLTQGPQVPLFENRLKSYCNAKHAVAVNSATSALHIACLALGLKAGDWLWTSPITFVASANCGLYCGAQVDFVDIDPATFNMCAKALAVKLDIAEREGRLPKIVIPVHLCGQSCDMQAIHGLSEKYGFHIIEDASHAIGGRYLDAPIGNCQFSDITIFSFHPVKIITTAEGGLATTNDASLAQNMALYRSHGVTRDPSLMTSKSDGPWYYEQLTLGYNYRMTELQAALGVSQVDRLDTFVTRRHEVCNIYTSQLADLPLVAQAVSLQAYSALHLYIVRLDMQVIKKSHHQVFSKLREANIGVNLHYIPVHMQPFYRAMGFRSDDFPEAERYYTEAISLPIFPGLDYDQQNFIIESLSEVLCK